MPSSFNEKTLSAILTTLKSGQYNLLIGSGVSLNSKNSKGIPLPSAETLRVQLCKLKNVKLTSTLQRVYSLLSRSEIEEHIVRRFGGCSPGISISRLPTFVWRRIFSFNVDDALEAAYGRPGALQKGTSFNFAEQYVEVRERTEVPIIHLHGWVQRPNDGFVFSMNEYVRQTNPINPWMVVLSQFLAVEPFIIAGTSLEEFDLEYYLAHRTEVSARPDRGPSILIEPYPDDATIRDCKKYGLELFHGTSEQFFEYLDKAAGERKPAFELLPASTVQLFPEGTAKQLISSFAADFETVPENFIEEGSASRFLYGHAPTWTDLANNVDVGRSITRDVIVAAAENLKGISKSKRLLLLLDQAGGGKTTILRRIAKEFSQQEVKVLTCSALSRIDAQSTAEAIELIVHPVVVIVDNFADQAWSIIDAIQRLKRRDVLFIGAERSYRWNYLRTAIASVPYGTFDGRPLTQLEAESLVILYQQAGIAGAGEALSNKAEFAKKIVSDPIAVACCRILKDFRPLDRIVKSVVEAATDVERFRYLVVSLAHYCLRGGVRYEVLASVAGRKDWDEQFAISHPLPLAYFEGSEQSFVVPLNGSIGSQVLEFFAINHRDRLLDTFISLANAIAPRVNRKTIMNRTPEARLAGRLFDFDQVVLGFLREDADKFYSKTKTAWQWNSRYWEQVALMHLHRFQSVAEASARSEALRDAVGHARHAVAIERHPLTLTTLAKIVAAQLGQPGVPTVSTYEEAFTLFGEAIDDEKRNWNRMSPHGFVGIFHATKEYIALGGSLTLEQRSKLRTLIGEASLQFKGMHEIEENIRILRQAIS